MPLDGAIGGSRTGGPARAPGDAASPACIEAQSGDDHEYVVAAGVDGDPIAGTVGIVVAKGQGGHRRIEETCGPQDEGGRTRAIIGGIEFRGGVARAVNVGQSGDAIACRHGDLDVRRRGGRGDGNAVAQDGSAAGDVLIYVRRGGGAACEEEAEQQD